MADSKKLDDEPEIPVGFPDNVNPSEENVKAFKDQQDRDRKALEDGNVPDFTEARVGEAIRSIPLDEREPEQSPSGKSQVKKVRQSKTVNK